MRKEIASSIEVCRNDKTGTTLLKDLMSVIWKVVQKDGSPITENQFNTILAEDYGFFDCTREFKLMPTKEPYPLCLAE